MPIVEDSILSVIYVAAGFVYSFTPEISRRHNATGVPSFREHTFEHPFLLMALEFLVQALCIPLWLIITGGYTPPRNPQRNHIAQWGEAPRYDNVEDRPEGDADADADAPLLGAEDNLNDQGHDHHDNDQAAPVVNDDDDVAMLGAEENLDVEGAVPDVPPPNNPAWNQRPVDQTKFNKFLFVVPAFFDLSRYALLYIALKLTYNSSFMLMRCAAVMFTVGLRKAFLSKHMAKYMWVSIGAVVVGLGLIGITDFIHRTPPGFDRYGIAAGCLLMVMSQIMIAMQIVYEEKFMDKHSIHPLRIVGLEGCFGSVVAVFVLLPFSFISSGPFSELPHSRIVHIEDAFLQMRSSWILALCVVGRVVSKTVLYYTGTRFVKNQHDSAKRIAIDAQHDLIIWGVSLAYGWQQDFWPQIIGYVLVVLGMLVYCDVLPLPKIFLPPAVPPPAGPLLEHEQLMLQGQGEIRHNDHEENNGFDAEAEGDRDGEDNNLQADRELQPPV